MREIKFRGKDIKTNKWIYGYYIKHLPYTPAPLAIDVETAKKELEKDYEHYIMYDGFSDWNMPRNTEHRKIFPETVGLYTGFKDKNGKDIYEGDIIKSYANLGYEKRQKKVEIISQVVYLIKSDKTLSRRYTNECSKFGTIQLNKEQDYTNFDWSVFFNCEVIGNIYDKKS